MNFETPSVSLNTSPENESHDEQFVNNDTLEFKYKVLSYYNEGKSINQCAKYFNIDRRIISRWKKVESQIFQTKIKRKRCAVKSIIDRSHFPILETQLYSWINEKRHQGICLSIILIKLQAINMFNTIYKNTPESSLEFKASNGWFGNFCYRKNLVLRRITTSGRDLPKNSVEIIKQFFSENCQYTKHEFFKDWQHG
ncbi:unnamed protein product [Brachionus calyciflorus]|uniref:HTH CENPB-type domain-containing protein n=1 Tax=Brachionus calyciflorus TaxID=104777 RepID=A0A814EIV3_9BILA|nr:unnamed protein product [Brachionus calyciflorus]